MYNTRNRKGKIRLLLSSLLDLLIRLTKKFSKSIVSQYFASTQHAWNLAFAEAEATIQILQGLKT